jgi:hypothetical protein
MVAAGPHAGEATDIALNCSITYVVRNGKWSKSAGKKYTELLQAMIMAGAGSNGPFSESLAARETDGSKPNKVNQSYVSSSPIVN